MALILETLQLANRLLIVWICFIVNFLGICVWFLFDRR